MHAHIIDTQIQRVKLLCINCKQTLGKQIGGLERKLAINQTKCAEIVQESNHETTRPVVSPTSLTHPFFAVVLRGVSLRV